MKQFNCMHNNLEDDNLVTLYEPYTEHEKSYWAPIRYAERLKEAEN